MADMSQRIQPLTDTPAFFAIVVMMILGIGIKMGLFPLHGWLPDSYTYAPPPATALISGVMTKVSAYVIFRFFYFVFDPADSAVHMALEVLGWIAAVGIIVDQLGDRQSISTNARLFQCSPNWLYCIRLAIEIPSH